MRLLMTLVSITHFSKRRDFQKYPGDSRLMPSTHAFSAEMFPLWMGDVALLQAGVGHLLAGGLVSISALHKVSHLVTEHQDAVAQ